MRQKIVFGGGVKSLLPPSAAEYSFKTDVFFMILGSQMMKNTSVLNLNLARSAEKRLMRWLIVF
jgi:hypothetical protein